VPCTRNPGYASLNARLRPVPVRTQRPAVTPMVRVLVRRSPVNPVRSEEAAVSGQLRAPRGGLAGATTPATGGRGGTMRAHGHLPPCVTRHHHHAHGLLLRRADRSRDPSAAHAPQLGPATAMPRTSPARLAAAGEPEARSARAPMRSGPPGAPSRAARSLASTPGTHDTPVPPPMPASSHHSAPNDTTRRRCIYGARHARDKASWERNAIRHRPWHTEEICTRFAPVYVLLPLILCTRIHYN